MSPIKRVFQFFIALIFILAFFIMALKASATESDVRHWDGTPRVISTYHKTFTHDEMTIVAGYRDSQIN